MGALATYSAYMIGQFIKKYPQARDFSQAGAILFGKHARWGREIFGVVMIIVLLMIMAAHVVAFQIMMITLVDKYVCSIVWAFIGAFVQYIGTIPRTMKNTSLLSALSSISVLIAVFMVMVDTGVNDRDPDGTKRQHPGAFDRRPNVSESSTVTGIMNIVLSYAGHVAYFSFAHELRKPTDYNKAVFAQLGTATFLYALVGGVTYYNVGYTVAGLSLSSASPLVSKAAYGVASLTIVMAGVVNAHVAAKYFYNRYFQELSRDKTFKARFVWHCIIGGLWLIAFLLAILIPSFQHMLSLVSSLITGFITYGLPGVLYYKYVLKGSRWSSRVSISLLLKFPIYENRESFEIQMLYYTKLYANLFIESHRC